ncbi:MAG TPA: metallophosphoesterase [Myxococcota bacterium]|nr:metallophosphoesterase [Myxococcota bacterium]
MTAAAPRWEIRIAAAGDLHVDPSVTGPWLRALEPVSDEADALLLAGDLTQLGVSTEAEALAEALAPITIPIFAVLGNHDLHSNQGDRVRRILERAQVCVLEGQSTTLMVSGHSVGIAGTIGFGGGFPGAEASDFGEPELKQFVARSRRLADSLEAALGELDTDVRIALTHYAPVPETLHGERREIYPFLGSHFLGSAIDATGADLAIHGHAHLGSEEGKTPGGVVVRNVAQPVIRAPYRVFRFAA